MEYFVAAAFFAGWLLISNGVPLMPVLCGTALAGIVNLWNRRRCSANR